MKLKRHQDFITETQIYSSTVSHNRDNEITYDISDEMKENIGYDKITIEKYIKDFINILELKSAHIIIHDNEISIKGVTTNFWFKKNINIEINQKGNFIRFFDHSSQIEVPKMTFDEIDVEPLVKICSIKSGYMDKYKNFNINQIIQYPMNNIKEYITLDKDQRDNYLKSLESGNKFNLFESKIKYDFDTYILGEFESYETDPSNWAKHQAEKLNLIEANIIFTQNKYSIKGKTKEDLNVLIEQNGEFDAYGSNYKPKFDKPIFKINDINVYPLFKHILKNRYLNYDMTALTFDVIKKIYNVFELPNNERDNYLKSLEAGNKFNLFESNDSEVLYDIDQYIEDLFTGGDVDINDYIESVKNKLNLKSGKIVIHRTIMEIRGKDIYSNRILMLQVYSHFISDTPGDPMIEFNGIDVLPLLLKIFNKDEKIKINEVNFPLEKIYQYIKLSDEERKNVLNNYNILKKYNL